MGAERKRVSALPRIHVLELIVEWNLCGCGVPFPIFSAVYEKGRALQLARTNLDIFLLLFKKKMSRCGHIENMNQRQKKIVGRMASYIYRNIQY